MASPPAPLCRILPNSIPGPTSRKSRLFTARVRSSTSPLERVVALPGASAQRTVPLLRASGSALGVVSLAPEPEGTEVPPGSAVLTYLEGNSWVFEVGGVRLLVDPVLEGPLDFGIPALYKAYKKTLREKISIKTLVEAVDGLLITQSYDDHCHLNTLRPLAALCPDILVVATPNAQPLLAPLFTNVTYLEPGESARVASARSTGGAVVVKAIAGPVLGPPWQRPENGYILRGSHPGCVSVFLEPHCQPKDDAIQAEQVDVLVTPVVKQVLPFYTLVSGQEDAARLAQALGARRVVPMANGDLEASGLFNAVVSAVGTLDAFREMLKKAQPTAEVLEPTPGVPLVIPPETAD